MGTSSTLIVTLERPGKRPKTVARFRGGAGHQNLQYTLWLLENEERLRRLHQRWPDIRINTEFWS